MQNDFGDLLKVLVFILIIIGSIVSQVLKDRKNRAPRPAAPKTREPEVIVFGGQGAPRPVRPSRTLRSPSPPRQPPDEGDDLFRRLAEDLGLPAGTRPGRQKPASVPQSADWKRRVAAPPPASAPFSAGVAPAVLRQESQLVPAARAVRAKGISQKPSRAAGLMGPGSAGLRRAILIHEILGKPRALRDFDATG